MKVRCTIDGSADSGSYVHKGEQTRDRPPQTQKRLRRISVRATVLGVVSTVRLADRSKAILRLNESDQLFVYLVLERRAHAMRRAFVHL